MGDIGEIRGRLTLEDLTSKPADTATSHIKKFDKASEELAKDLNSKLSPSLDKSGTKFKEQSSAVKSAGEALGSMASKIVGIATAYLSVSTAVDLFKSSVAAISESETATALLEARIKSTGGVAGKTAEEINAFAESLSNKIKRDDEEISLAAAELLKFTDISGDQFERIIKLAADMAGPTGDLVAEVEKLGKAFQEPDEALSLLERSVGRFTDAEEEAIKKLAQSGDEAGAAAKMMEILERRVGGTAEAYGKTLGGALAGISINWENQLELLQEGLSPALKQVAKDFEDYITSAEGQAEVIQLGKDLGALVLELSKNVRNLADGFKEIDLGAIVNLIKLLSELLGIIQKIGQYTKYINPMYWELKLLEKVLGDSANEAGRLSKNLTDLTRNAPKINPASLAILPPGVLGTPQRPGGNPNPPKIDTAEINRAKQLAKELANLESQLKRDAAQAVEMAAALRSGFDQKQIDSIIRTRTLHNQWLADVEKFGLSAANALKSLRAAVYDTGKAADQAQKVWDLVQKVRDTHLEPIVIEFAKGDFDPIEYLDQLEQYKEELAAVELANENAYAEQREAVQAQLQDQADYFRDSLKSPREELEDFKRHINNLADASIHGGEALLTAAEAERLRAKAAEQYYSQQLNAWTGFLTQLGDQLGGFFAKVASIAQSVQNVNSTAQGLGGWSSMAGAWGGVLAAYAAVYSYADAMVEKAKSLKYGTTGSLSVTNELQVTSYIKDAGMVLTRQIQDVLKSIEDALRVSVKDLAAVEIRVRNNGKDFQAWVKGVYINTFTDLNSAIRAALLEAIKDPDSSLRGMSEIMQQGLEKWTSPDMEGLLDFLTNLREIGDLSLSPLIIQLQKSALEFNNYRDVLAGLDQSSQAVIDAQKELTEAQMFAYEQVRAQLFGIDLSAAEAVRNLAGFQKGMGAFTDSLKSGLTSSIEAAQRKLDALNKPQNQGSGGGFGVGGQKGPGTNPSGPTAQYMMDQISDDLDDEKRRLQQSIDEWKKQLAEIPDALTDQEIDLGIFTALESELRKSGKHAELIAEMERERVKHQYEELRLQLIGIGAWERWAGIWQELYDQALADAGKGGMGGRGGRSGGDRDSVRDFIKDKKYDLSLKGLTDYQKSLKELDRIYDEQLKKAGKDKQLRQELLKLKDQELAQMAEEAKKSTLGKFNEFLGLVTPFDKVRETAADLVKEIEGSPFGDARKARMIGRVLADVEKQIERMAQQAALNLFGEMSADLEKFGADEKLQTEIRRNMAILEHALKMAHYKTEIEILKAQNKLAPEVLAALDNAFNFLSGIDPTKFLGPIANDNNPFGPHRYATGDRSPEAIAARAAEDLAESLKHAADLLKKYQEDDLSDLDRRKREIVADFDIIRKAFGDTPAIMAEFNDAIHDATEDSYKSLTDFYKSLESGPESGQTIAQQFDSINSALNDTLNALAGGDTSKMDLAAEQGQQFIDLLGKMYGTSTGGFEQEKRALMERLRAQFAAAGLNVSDFSSLTQLQSSIAAGNTNTSNQNTDRVVSASDRIAQVISLNGAKNERLLTAAVVALNDLLTAVQEANSNNDVPSFGYNNG